MTREARAVRKAGRARLLADMARATWLVEDALHKYGTRTMLARAYVLGVIEAEASLTVRACLLAAWGE